MTSFLFNGGYFIYSIVKQWIKVVNRWIGREDELFMCKCGHMEVNEKGNGWGSIRFTNHTIEASGLSARGTDNLGHCRIANEDIPTDMIPVIIKAWKENRIVASNRAKRNRKDLGEKAMIKQLALNTRSQAIDSFGICRPTRKIDLE